MLVFSEQNLIKDGVWGAMEQKTGLRARRYR
jgi:hypothetical protein